jgi:1-acyl-sn-glycerol-3-phosphate acyltransferase
VTRDLGWARSGPACAVRELLLSAVFRPLIALYTRRSVTGREHLEGLDGPVVFVANHSSHMDTPLLLRALPWRWRRRTAVAAAADYFYGSALLAHVVSLAFGTVPVERDGDAASGASELDLLLGHGWSVVVYAEGTRSRNGEVGKLRAGAAVLATERELPIVPVHVSGTHATMPVGRSWMRRGPGFSRRPVRVAFGPAIQIAPGEHRIDVMERVREFLESQGAATTPRRRAVPARTGSAG